MMINVCVYIQTPESVISNYYFNLPIITMHVASFVPFLLSLLAAASAFSEIRIETESDLQHLPLLLTGKKCEVKKGSSTAASMQGASCKKLHKEARKCCSMT